MLFYGGAFYADLVEEDAGDDDGLGDGSERVGYVGIVAGGDDAGAKAAIVEFVEGSSANELPRAVGMYLVEEARRELAAAQSFDGVDVFALVLCQGEQALVELVLCEGLVGFDEEDASARVRSLCR